MVAFSEASEKSEVSDAEMSIFTEVSNPSHESKKISKGSSNGRNRCNINEKGREFTVATYAPDKYIVESTVVGEAAEWLVLAAKESSENVTDVGVV